MKLKQHCKNYVNVDGFNYCPICGNEMIYIKIVNDMGKEEIVKIYNLFKTLSHTMSNNVPETLDKVRWILKQHGELYCDNFDMDLFENFVLNELEGSV